MFKLVSWSLLYLLPFQALAGLELVATYQDWEHYESPSLDTGKAVVLGVANSKGSISSNMVALRCTTEGVNLLFFKSLPNEQLVGYMAQAYLDDGSAFTMDVWVKGRTHWATVPAQRTSQFLNAERLTVTLSGDDNQTEQVEVSLRGFESMYQQLLPSCEE